MSSRYVTNLDRFDEINLLLKYLYLSDEHSVTFENVIGIRFKLYMDDDFELKRQMLNGVTDSVFPCPDIDHTTLMGIVDQLKKQPAVEFPERFANRWEEIKITTAANLVLNQMHQARMT